MFRHQLHVISSSAHRDFFVHSRKDVLGMMHIVKLVGLLLGCFWLGTLMTARLMPSHSPTPCPTHLKYAPTTTVINTPLPTECPTTVAPTKPDSMVEKS